MSTSGTYIDNETLLAIEKDLDAAHKSFGHGNLALPSKSALLGIGVKLAEVVGTTFAFSWANAAAGGELTLGAVPMDATVGAACVLLAACGVLGDDLEEHALNVGLGGLSAYAARAGATYGHASSTSPATTTSGLTDIVGRRDDNHTGAVAAAHAAGRVHAGAAVMGPRRWFVRKAA